MAIDSPGSRHEPIKRSTMGRWRAAVLVGVHVVAALHIWHWKSNGTTISPVEPSEAMQTLELGYVNAGFIFFGLAILSTLIFGRWFCGWGCHIVALQDLCGAMLKRVGIRPKPVRSRLLVWVPVFAALYMFVWPQVQRIWQGRPAPGWVWHLQTDDFWGTFPNVPIAFLTFAVCGFLIVYVLGAKGFCTYGCPYGGIFYHADRASKGRIRVTDECRQCGHCTAVCTSNVRVAEEVKLFGKVVDPGCMKCMDCVSVCPTGALYYGFRPQRGLVLPMAEPTKTLRRSFDFTIAEEIGLGVVFLWTMYAVRGLYDAIPFLLSLGIASISAFLVVCGARLAYRREVRFQKSQWKVGGNLKAAGWVGAFALAGWIAFLTHSTVLQFWVHEGDRWLSKAAKSNAIEDARKAETAYERVLGLAWLPVAEWQYKMGSIKQNLGQFEQAIVHFENALRLDEDRPNTRLQLADLYLRTGNRKGVVEQFAKLSESGVDLGSNWQVYAEALITEGQFEQAIEPLRSALRQPEPPNQLRLQLGLALSRKGSLAEAAQELRTYTKAVPNDPAGFANLGWVLAEARDWNEALEALQKAVRLDPNLAGAHSALGRVHAELGDRKASWMSLSKAIRLQPLSPQVIEDLKAAAERTNSAAEWLDIVEPSVEKAPELAYATSTLLRLLGRELEAEEYLAKARSLAPNLPPR